MAVYCPHRLTAMSESRPSHAFAVITGASRGIGAAYAEALADRGYDLLLIGRDRLRLESVASRLPRRGGEVFLETLDLAQPGATHRLYAMARDRRPAVDLLINNAGFGLFGAMADMPLPRMQAMLQVHVTAVTESMRLFLPGMVERRSGAIINVSSVAGAYSLPYCAEYAATKAYVIRLSEAVAEEVRPSGVLVQACCPATTDTDFHATAGFRPTHGLGAQTAQQVVAASLRALQRGRVVAPTGWRARGLMWLGRYGPGRVLLRAAARRMNPART